MFYIPKNIVRHKLYKCRKNYFSVKDDNLINGSFIFYKDYVI